MGSSITCPLLSPGETCDAVDPITEIAVGDHELWWRDQSPSERLLLRAFHVYASDTSESIAELTCSLDMDDEADVKVCTRRASGDPLWVLSPSVEAPTLPYLCSPTEKPYRFTVIGDSHTRVFDVISLRTGNDMEVASVFAASMYGLRNLSSATGAGRTFADLIAVRRQAEDPLNVLVVNLGDCDVSGLSWRKYLANETEDGRRRSLTALKRFLRENVDTPGGYSRVALMAVAPPTVKDQLAPWALPAQRPFNLASFDERAKATVSFNRALRQFCAARAFCSFIDPTPWLWGPEGVYKPFLNLLRPDIHLRRDRVFGLIAESLRLGLPDAQWCVKDDSGGGDIDILLSKVAENSPVELGFDPVVFHLPWKSQDGESGQCFVTAPHFLTASALAHEVALGKHVTCDDGEDMIPGSENPGMIVWLGKILNDALGVGWGTNRPLSSLSMIQEENSPNFSEDFMSSHFDDIVNQLEASQQRILELEEFVLDEKNLRSDLSRQISELSKICGSP
jgi:hypothetical protein